MKVSLFIISVFFGLLAKSQDITLQIVPKGDCYFRCSVINTNVFPVRCPISFLAYDNAFLGYSFSEMARKPFKVAWNVDFVNTPNYKYVEAKSAFDYFVSKQIAESTVFGFEEYSEKYLHLKWVYYVNDGKKRSPSFNIAYVHEGLEVEPPAPSEVGDDTLKKVEWMLGDSQNLDGTNTQLHLAFIYRERNPHELALFRMNGVAVADSAVLFPPSKSCILFTSSTIGYSSEIPLASIISTNILTISNGVWHCRIPWSDIWNQIPEADRAKLEAAGAVDLRWECGDQVSDPLPLWVGPIGDTPDATNGTLKEAEGFQ